MPSCCHGIDLLRRRYGPYVNKKMPNHSFHTNKEPVFCPDRVLLHYRSLLFANRHLDHYSFCTSTELLPYRFLYPYGHSNSNLPQPNMRVQCPILLLSLGLLLPPCCLYSINEDKAFHNLI